MNENEKENLKLLISRYANACAYVAQDIREGVRESLLEDDMAEQKSLKEELFKMIEAI